MNPLQKMRLMVARGVVKLVQEAGLQLIQADLLADETRDGIERVQNYGHRGNPPHGSTVAAVAVEGSRDHLLIVACEHPDYVPQLEPGEVAMYSMFKQLFKMDQNGNVILVCKNFTVAASGNVQMVANGSLSINAQDGSTMSGGLNADSVIADKVIGGGVDLEKHAHTGVTAGGDDSGAPIK